MINHIVYGGSHISHISRCRFIYRGNLRTNHFDFRLGFRIIKILKS